MCNFVTVLHRRRCFVSHPSKIEMQLTGGVWRVFTVAALVDVYLLVKSDQLRSRTRVSTFRVIPRLGSYADIQVRPPMIAMQLGCRIYLYWFY